MIFQTGILNQIVDRALDETLQFNYAIEDCRVGKESMLMLLQPAFNRGLEYINKCAEEEYGWKEKYESLRIKMSSKDFSHAQTNIKSNQKNASLEDEVRRLKSQLSERDLRIESLEKEIAELKGIPVPEEPENIPENTPKTIPETTPEPTPETTKEEVYVDKKSSSVTIQRHELEKLQNDLRMYKEKEESGPATSNNSSLPPSKNPIGHKHNYSVRPKTGRKPGGQRGHKGHTHELSPNPDQIIQHYPTKCPFCGESVDPDSLRVLARRQKAHWPPILIQLIEHQLLGGKCKCGHHIKGEFPEGVSAPFSFSDSFLANLAYMSVYLTSPYKRAAEFLSNALGINISPATIYNGIMQVAKAVEPHQKELLDKVATAEVNCFDETALKVKVDDENFWIWVNVGIDAQGNFLGYYMKLCDDRTHVNIEKICPDKKVKYAVHDRKSDYFNPDYLGCKNHQVCLIHLKRDCQKVVDAVKECDWPKRFQGILDRIFEMKNEWTNPNVLPDITQLEKDIDDMLNERPELPYEDHQKKLNTLMLGLEKVRPYLLTCLKVFAVPPTNNESERSFRLAKSKQNVSGCFRTKEGAEDFVKIFCTIQNLRRMGENPLEFIIRSLEDKRKNSEKS